MFDDARSHDRVKESISRNHGTCYINYCCRSNGCRERCAIRFKLDVCLSPAYTKPNKDCFSVLIWGLRLVTRPSDIFCRVPFRQNHRRPRPCSQCRLLSRTPTLVPSSESTADDCRFVPLKTRGRSKVKTAILHPSLQHDLRSLGQTHGN